MGCGARGIGKVLMAGAVTVMVLQGYLVAGAASARSSSQTPASSSGAPAAQKPLPSTESTPVKKPTIRLKVGEEAGDADGLGEKLRVPLKNFFALSGLTVVEADATGFDADLEITVKGKALSDRYSMFLFTGGGTEYYTGAEVSGRLLFEAQNGKVLAEQPWDGKEPTPYRLEGGFGPSSPKGAPFSKALDASSLWGHVGTFLLRGLGPEIATQYFEALAGERALRTHAFAGLTSIGAPAVSTLLGMIGKGAHVDEAESALQKIGASAAPELLRQLKSNDPAARRAAAKVLRLVRSDELLPHVIAATKDADAAVRSDAVNALRFYSAHDKTLAPLKDALSDQDVEVRRQSVKAIREKGPLGVDVLITVLQSAETPVVRHEAAEALGEIRDPKAIMPLIGVLEQTIPLPLRTTVRNALAKFDDPRVVPALIAEVDRAKNAKDPISAKLALRDLLKSKTGQDFGVDPVAWRAWWDGRQKETVAARIRTAREELDGLLKSGLAQSAVATSQDSLRQAEVSLEAQRYDEAGRLADQSRTGIADMARIWKEASLLHQRLERAKAKGIPETTAQQLTEKLNVALAAIKSGSVQKGEGAIKEAKQLFLSVKVHPGTGLSVLTDSRYVDFAPGDKSAEASNLVASLEHLGYHVRQFQSFDLESLRLILEESRAVFIPSLDKPTQWTAAIGEKAREAFGDYVREGGIVVTVFPNTQLIAFLKDVFGVNLVGSSVIDVKKVAGLDGAPRELFRNTAVLGVDAQSLPQNAERLYEDNDHTGVITRIPVGDGAIIVMGWDWGDAVPTGQQDGGWLKVLDLLLKS